MVITLVISVFLPIFLWVFFAKKDKGISLAILAGSLGFVVPQLLIRIPILQFLSSNSSWMDFAARNIALYLAVIALSAALFETVGRYLVFKLFLRRKLSFYAGLGAGIGHGGVESIVLVGLSYVSNLTVSIMFNMGALSNVPGIEDTVAILINTPATSFLAAGFERAFTIAFHIALSVILCLFMSKKKTAIGFIICVVSHTAVDFFVPLMSGQGLPIYLIEGVVFIIAVISVFVTVKCKPRFLNIAIPKSEAQKAVEEGF